MTRTSDDKTPSLRDLVAAPVTIPVGDAHIKIAPMSWYAGSEAMEQLLPALPALARVLQPGMAREQKMGELLAIFAGHRDEICEFASIASGLPAEDIGELPPAAMGDLLIGLLELNIDFFERSLPALARRWNSRLDAMTQRLLAATASPTSSSG